MTSFHYDLANRKNRVAVTEEVFDVIKKYYHPFNSFFLTEEVSNYRRGMYSMTCLARSINFGDFEDESETTNFELLMIQLLQSANHGTIVSCYDSSHHLHCGIANDTLHVHVVDPVVNSDVESLFTNDEALGNFILEHCHRSTEEYKQAIATTHAIRSL